MGWVERLAERPVWYADAACRDVPTRVMYPEQWDGSAHDEAAATRIAKLVCGMCDVKPECLEWAIANRERYGVWGGLTETERRKVARIRREKFRKHRVA